MARGFLSGSGKMQHTSSCSVCGRYLSCTSPKFKPIGKGKEKILLVGQRVQKTEDEAGKLLDSSYGDTLSDSLKEMGYDLEEDFWYVPATICYGSTNKQAIPSCRNNLMKVIERLQPKAVITLGGSATFAVLGGMWKKTEFMIDKWRGFHIPFHKYNTFVCPVVSPDYLNDKRNTPQNFYFAKDIRNVIDAQFAGTSRARKDFSNIHLLKEDKDIIQYLTELYRRKPKYLAFDYETTGLKPYNKGHKIVSVSFAEKIDEGYAFFMKDCYVPYLKKVLEEKKIRKVASNMIFEHIWSKVISGIEVQGWYWDTMLAAHILSNRGNISSIKTQGFLRYGLEPYDEDVGPYLKGIGANGLNNIHRAPKTKLLKYNAIDSMLELAVCFDQMKEMDNDRIEAYKLFHKGTLAFARQGQRGILIDEEQAEIQLILCNKKMKEIEELIASKKIGKIWKKKFGRIDCGSNLHKAWVLYDELKMPVLQKTKKGDRSTDKEALDEMEHPLAEALREWQKYSTMAATFLNGILREVNDDGRIRPNFPLHTAISYRGSSTDPNFQNMPIRDPDQSHMIRSLIKTTEDRCLIEIDFSALEVRIACCYHKDPTMIQYLKDDYDMHTDQGQEIWGFSDKLWNEWKEKDPSLIKRLRYFSKNRFVFPEFYGSYWAQVAPDIWKGLKDEKVKKYRKEILDILRRKGVKRKGEIQKDSRGRLIEIDTGKGTFFHHIKEIERDFWNNRFPQYKQYKSDKWERYLHTGSFSSKTHFLYDGIYSKNQSVNLDIQGDAFHCLLWSYIEIEKEIKKEEIDATLCMEIHDSIIADVACTDVERYIEQAKCIMTKRIVEEFDWINIPLEVEVEICPPGGSWHEKIEEQEWFNEYRNK